MAVSLSSEPSLVPPDWPHCAEGRGPQNPVGCRGISVDARGTCLAHMDTRERRAYLDGVWPGSDIDHRGTTFTDRLLRGLLRAYSDPTNRGSPVFGTAMFEGATFQGPAVFEGALFRSTADFGYATFESRADFTRAIFHKNANFSHTTFQSDAEFTSTTFESSSAFQSVTFQSAALFSYANFQRGGNFCHSTFQNNAGFHFASFRENALLSGAVFERESTLGPLLCLELVELSEALFSAPVTLMLAAPSVICRRTRWSSTAELRLRYATVDFTQAVFEYPLTIASDDALAWGSSSGHLDEGHLPYESDEAVRIASLQGVDAAHLVLADVDLSDCLFAGTVHLDQVRLEGSCRFGTTPSGTHWQRWRPVRFTRRRTLAEEHHWRAIQPGAVAGWVAAETRGAPVGPTRLAPVYRAMRKAFEDGKNEPGAADFYYGEMEMRRQDSQDTGLSERALLHGYWALSGYGLRAGRALGWLGAAMVATVTVMMLWGLPADDPKPLTTGRQSGQNIMLTTDTPAPVNPTGPLSERVTAERFEKSLRVVINSVIFRSSGQNLTTAGTYTEMLSRIAEPVLLGLAVLAIRNRVKR